MRNRGKREEEYYNYNNGYGEGYVEFTCKKHPSSSSVSRGGICAFCLTDRLYQLVCPQCGEQRLSSSSSCSCSCTNTNTNTNNNNNANTADLFSSNNPNNYSSSADVGNVGRISFLLENDKVINNNNYYEPKIEPRLSSASHVEDFNTLRRSNSICVGVDRKESSKDKFWKIGRLFRKKKEKSYNNNNNNINEEEEENININNNNNNNNNYDGNNNNNNGVTRSRSVSNFRGFYDTEEIGNNNFPISTSSAARASSVSTGNFYADSAKMSCFSESEARFSNFDYLDVNGLNKNNNYNNNSNNNNNIYSVKESEFTSSDDPAYIDLKLDGMSSTSDHYSKKVPDLATMRRSRLGASTKEFGFNNRRNQEHDMFMRSGSCRRSSVTERELRNCRKSSKVWKWFFKHQSSSSANRDDRDDPHHDFNNSFDPS